MENEKETRRRDHLERFGKIRTKSPVRIGESRGRKGEQFSGLTIKTKPAYGTTESKRRKRHNEKPRMIRVGKLRGDRYND